MRLNPEEEHFCTLFDSQFMAQGFALYQSLTRVYPDGFKLWILCLDDVAAAFFRDKKFPEVHVLTLQDIETPDLLKVKVTRKINEYCWTLTPFLPDFILQNHVDVLRITYLDADMFFFRHPAEIFEEFEASKKSALITEHDYASAFDQSETSGVYCVQFMTFTRAGLSILQDWKSHCLAWCHDYFEDGKFGDQKYLEAWPGKFDVHVLQKKDLVLGPWNNSKYGKKIDPVIYHFHGLKIFANKIRLFHTYKIINLWIYDRYLNFLKEAIRLSPKVSRGLAPSGVAENLRRIKEKLSKTSLWVKNV